MLYRMWLLLVCVMFACTAAKAQGFPDRPIKIICPAAAGTATDRTARFVAERLSRDLKWAVVVENKVGANGIIAMELVAQAPADGYTLLLTPSTIYINKLLQPKANFDPVADFTPIAKVGAAHLVLVTAPSSRFNSLKEAIDYMRANPGKVSYSTGGSGSTTHLAFALMTAMEGVQALHVPYRGGDMALSDAIAGNVDMTFTAIASARSMLSAGRLKPLAVSGRRRATALPDVPTLVELGFKDFEIGSGLGFSGPKGLDPNVVTRLSMEILKIGRSPEFAEFAKSMGVELEILDSGQYAAAGKAEFSLWRKAVAESGAKAD